MATFAPSSSPARARLRRRRSLRGADVRTRSSRPQTLDEHRDGGGLVSLRIYESKKPVIAAINGPAVGVGITMTLPMDVRIASDKSRMGFVFAKRGIVPEACSSWFLPRLVGSVRRPSGLHRASFLPRKRWPKP
jgi:enoyl-CoA hydratase/carnithine racemase